MRLVSLAMIASAGFVLPFTQVLGQELAPVDPTVQQVRRSVDRGLAYLARVQARDGHWEAEGGVYPVAMTSLAGMALLMDGNTLIQGRYARNLQSAVGYVLSQAKDNGLIGNPTLDSRYMYGHGFAMLFLSQVMGEEEDKNRRAEIHAVLTRAVEFCGNAQTREGGWGYLSAFEGGGFDEGSVTVTQIQGVRGCRNAGIRVPKSILDKGIQYIERCVEKDGGVRYQLKGGATGGRAPITAAAVACLFNAGQYDSPLVNRFIAFADKTLADPALSVSSGHWHYAQYYFGQVCYRQGGKRWDAFRERIFSKLIESQETDGKWPTDFVGGVYTTTLSLAILQMENDALPIYQR